MSTTEFWWEFDARVRRQKKIEKADSPGGKFTEAEWEAARRKHKEMKENGWTTDGATR
jgi:hypothetical protein